MDNNKKKAILYTAMIVSFIIGFTILVITVPIFVLTAVLVIAVLGGIYVLYRMILEDLDDDSL